MKPDSEESIKAMANVLAGMVDEDHISYYSDAVYVIEAIRSGMVPGVIVDNTKYGDQSAEMLGLDELTYWKMRASISEQHEMRLRAERDSSK